jgi:hypothetical protein
MSKLTYGFEKTLERATFEEAVQRVTEALQRRGSGCSRRST